MVISNFIYFHYYHSSHLIFLPYEKAEAKKKKLLATEFLKQMKLASWRRFAALTLLYLVYKILTQCVGPLFSCFWCILLWAEYKCDFQDVEAELKKLENLKDDLEAELKRVTLTRTLFQSSLLNWYKFRFVGHITEFSCFLKVNTSITSARARLRNAREEREQFDNASNEILMHLKSKVPNYLFFPPGIS